MADISLNGNRRPEPDGAQLYREIIGELQRDGRTERRAELEQAIRSADDPAMKASLANLLTHCCFVERDYPAALAACRQWVDLAPDDHQAKDSLLSVLSRLNRFEDVIQEAGSRLESEPDNERLYSSLASAFGRMGRTEEARNAGDACLLIRDKAATGRAKDLTDVEVPPFDSSDRDRNVIAFSLYGENPAYCDGAVRNAIASRYLYPEWRCRFYVDESVSARVTDRLLQEGAKVRLVGGLPAGRFGTFWRFLVADEDGIDRYLVRDVDACLNLRERAAVEAWIASNRHFHVMRDGLTHTEPMLAGMWGGVRAALPSMQKGMIEFCESAPLSRTADQMFLREHAWPTVRQSVLVHDSEFSLGDSQPFPTEHVPPAPRVGQAVTQPTIRWADASSISG